MKKLTILLVILAFFAMSMNGLADPAYGNVGPTTEFGFDIYIADELVAEGSAADAHETTLTFTNPTADRVITVPDSDQTIGTATAIEDGLIVEADLNGDEEPADNDILSYDSTGANFSWQTPAQLLLVVTVGNPSDSQVGVWTGDGTLEGAASFTYDGSNLQLTGDIGSTGTKITKGWFTDLEVANDIAGSITGNAETITLTDNEDEALACPILFVDGATGDQGAESDDTDFTYNPSTGTVTATEFVGGGAGITDVTATANYILHLMDVDAADNDYLLADATGDADKIGDIIAMPDYARNITTTGDGDGTGTITITGTLADGTTGQTDVIALASSVTTQGVKAFCTITAIVSASTAGTFQVGIGDLIGLPNSIDAVTDVYYKTVDGVAEFGEITGKVNTTYDTVDCGTIAQNEDITLFYHP